MSPHQALLLAANQPSAERNDIMRVEVSLGKKEETKIHRYYQLLISDHQSWVFSLPCALVTEETTMDKKISQP